MKMPLSEASTCRDSVETTNRAIELNLGTNNQKASLSLLLCEGSRVVFRQYHCFPNSVRGRHENNPIRTIFKNLDFIHFATATLQATFSHTRPRSKLPPACNLFLTIDRACDFRASPAAVFADIFCSRVPDSARHAILACCDAT